ncbi:site-specific tyrosine recombinase XerD [Treponema sp.]
MGQALSGVAVDLYEGFLAAERPRVSSQGFVSLQGRAKRMLAWFEAEELDLCSVGIQEALYYQRWLSERLDEDGKPYTTGTMHNYLKTARRFFDYLLMTERVKANPFRELRYPRLASHLSRNFLSEAQMGRLLAELARFDEGATWYERERRYRVHVVAEFLYATGLRIAEACSLTETDIDLDARRVYLTAGKGGTPRTAFLTAYAADVLRLYLDSGSGATRHRYVRHLGHTLFGANKGRVATVVNAELERTCTRLELPVITTHGFRHSLGTHLLRSGCDMRHIQAILGHEALGTTQVYTHVDKDDLKRSLDAHHPRHWMGAAGTVGKE